MKEKILENRNGITLVALVVTIVVLLILAGITITYVMGDNSIFKTAQEAKNKTEEAMQNEQEYLNNLGNTVNEYIDGTNPPTSSEKATELELNSVRARIATGYTRWLTAAVTPKTASQDLEWTSSNTGVATVDNTGKITAKAVGTTNITVKTKDGSNLSKTCKVTVADGVDITTLTSIQSSNKVAKDSYGNLITVPGGFKVLTSEATNATKGIVIQDEDGNEFVWIPVDSVSKGEDVRADDIRLGRYTFDTTNGNPKKEQDADNYTEVVTINNYYQELTNDSGNTAAKNLEDFVTKTKAKGGYYFGRYEASQGIDGKVDTQLDKTVWIDITQPNAAIKAREMYNSSYVESDLINSYSWDTAGVFIQKYSGNINYANQTSLNTSKVNTGKSEDKMCNIFDMASNCREWSTEHYEDESSACGLRGGRYDINDVYMSHRGYSSTTFTYESISFRPIVYIK